MLNRFWVVAALAVVFVFSCGVTAQEKKKSGKSIDLTPSMKTASEKGLPKGLLAKLGEKTRDISPPGSTASVFANPEALFKAIDEMGIQVTDGAGTTTHRWIRVNGAPMIVTMSEDNAFVYVRLSLELKDVSSIPPERILSAMEENFPLTCCWRYLSNDTSLLAIAVIPAQSGTRQELRIKLDSMASMIISGWDLLRNSLK